MADTPSITHQQAQEAKHLVNTAGAFGALIALARDLDPATRARIRAAHDDKTVAMCCHANGEGLDCCVDILLDDPDKYTPDKITAAEDLLRRYRQQPP